MNKSERDRLGRIAAECIYGENPASAVSNIGISLVKEFPAIYEEFDAWLDIFAAERIVRLMIGYMAQGDFGQTNQESFDSLIRSGDAIEEAFIDWCVDTNTRAHVMVDESRDVTDLVSNPSLKEYMLDEATKDDSLALFASLLSGERTA